jgi:hypothetical protein
VAQLALPALTSTPETILPEDFRCFLESVTGEAWMRFWVNTAAAEAGVSETISARSSWAVFRMPAYVAAYR